MKITKDFLQADEVIAHEVRCWSVLNEACLDDASCRRVAVLEQSGYVVDLESRTVFQPDDRWGPFVNWWMDWMWAERKQRNYAKLASVMEGVARRSDPEQAERTDWCEMAKFYQQRYFRRIVAVVVTVGLLVGLWTARVQAAINDATLIYLGTEVVDTNGVPTPNNVYFVDCEGETLTVTISITFTDGAVALLTSDEYCQAKIYVEGSIEQIAIVAVADGPDAVKFVYLPMVAR